MAKNKAIEELIRDLPNEEGYFREEAARALAEHDREAVGPLLAALSSDNWRLRGGSAYVLGLIADSQATQPLTQALMKEDNEWIRCEMGAALGRIGNPAMPSLIMTLRKGNADVRYIAAMALAGTGSAETVEPLIEALQDEDWRVRGVAAQALGCQGNPTAIRPLVEALNDTASYVRRHAAWSLALIGGPAASRALSKALKDEDNYVRRIAEAALDTINPKCVHEFDP
jgi:bilin biosynthesis protein